MTIIICNKIGDPLQRTVVGYFITQTETPRDPRTLNEGRETGIVNRTSLSSTYVPAVWVETGTQDYGRVR